MPLAVLELGSKSQEIPKSILGLAERPYLKENTWSPRNELCPPHAEHACIQTKDVTQENNFKRCLSGGKYYSPKNKTLLSILFSRKKSLQIKGDDEIM